MSALLRLPSARAALALVVSAAACGGGESTKPTPTPTARPPALALSLSSVSFTGEATAAAPAAQQLSITNSGDGSLGTISVGTVSYAGQGGWLTATLGGSSAPTTLTLTPSTAGLAAGSYSATVPLAASGATSGASVGVTMIVTAAPARQLAVITAPNQATSGRTLGEVVVEVRNAAGGRVSGAAVPVTATVASGSGTLTGTTTVTSADGVARFTALTVNGSGNVALSFASPNLTSATTAAIAVTVPTPVGIRFPAAWVAVDSGASVAPGAMAIDATGAAISGATVTYSAAAGAPFAVDASGRVVGSRVGFGTLVARVAGTALADSVRVAVTPPAGPVVALSLAEWSLQNGTSVTVTVRLDMRGTTRRAGSGRITLQWPAAALAYVSHANPTTGASPLVNVASAPDGSLSLTFADAQGYTGVTDLLRVTFRATGAVVGPATIQSLVNELTATDFSSLRATAVGIPYTVQLR